MNITWVEETTENTNSKIYTSEIDGIRIRATMMYSVLQMRYKARVEAVSQHGSRTYEFSVENANQLKEVAQELLEHYKIKHIDSFFVIIWKWIKSVFGLWK